MFYDVQIQVFLYWFVWSVCHVLLSILSCVMQNFAGEKEEFLLFASLFEVTMVDPSIGTRLVTFELSIGETCSWCLYTG